MHHFVSAMIPVSGMLAASVMLFAVRIDFLMVFLSVVAIFIALRKRHFLSLKKLRDR